MRTSTRNRMVGPLLLAGGMLVSWLGLPPRPLAAQAGPGRLGDAAGTLSFSLELGPTRGGPTSGLVEELTRAGYDETIEGGCSNSLGFESCISTQTHPAKSAPGTAASITARWTASRRWSMGASLGFVGLGEANGYRGGSYLRLAYTAREIWIAGYWQPLPWTYVGGGPAWYHLRESNSQTAVSRWGAVGEAGVDVPLERWVHLRVGARAHFVPSTDVQTLHRLPIAIRPNWSHVNLFAGIGIRL
jgi:hypothetical protein